MKSFPKVFIVILNYNGKDYIKKCLSSVFKIEYPNFEVVLVDNNSTDGSLESAKMNFSKATFIKNAENLGFSTGNNVGIRYALERMAEYILVLNNDVEVEKEFLTKLIEVAVADEKIGILSPVILDGVTKEIWFSGGTIEWLKMRAVHKKHVKTADYYDGSFVSGCAMLIKADVFKRIGLFDEDFFLYWEDVDFSFRARKAGFKNVIVAASWIYHFENSEQYKKDKTYWLVISGLTFFSKNTPLGLKPWISIYTRLRKIKNWLDVRYKKNDLAITVQKAYKDFSNAKF